MPPRPLAYDFESSIGYWVCHTSHQYQQRLNAELAPFGITFRQFQVLATLVYEGEMTQAALAERLLVEPPTLAGILARMEREGWIERVGCEEDRRRKHLSLRDGARPIWAKVVACLTKMRTQATRGLSEQEVATLKELLTRVQANIRGPGPRSGSRLAPERNGMAPRRTAQTRPQ
jgi:MarR family transcriptional regulator for hemolysin